MVNVHIAEVTDSCFAAQEAAEERRHLSHGGELQWSFAKKLISTRRIAR